MKKIMSKSIFMPDTSHYVTVKIDFWTEKGYVFLVKRLAKFIKTKLDIFGSHTGVRSAVLRDKIICKKDKICEYRNEEGMGYKAVSGCRNLIYLCGLIILASYKTKPNLQVSVS